MKIELSVIWNNRDGNGTTWFFPRYCRTGNGAVFMTVQGIEESDYFTPVCESRLENGVWTAPRQIPGLQWHRYSEDIYEAYGDFTVYCHAPTDTVLMLGCSFFDL